MKECGLAGIVEAEEENLSLFLPKAKGGEDPIEPIKQEHVRLRIDSKVGLWCRWEDERLETYAAWDLVIRGGNRTGRGDEFLKSENCDEIGNKK